MHYQGICSGPYVLLFKGLSYVICNFLIINLNVNLSCLYFLVLKSICCTVYKAKFCSSFKT